MMKLVFLVVCVSVAYGLERRQIQTPKPQSQPKILRLESDVSPDGKYEWAYETENGISAEEAGQQTGTGEDAGTAAQGGYKYTTPDGLPVEIQYVANQDGFQPVGSVIPTPPPIPAEIVKALAYNGAHPEQDNQPDSPQTPPQQYTAAKSPYNPTGQYRV